MSETKAQLIERLYRLRTAVWESDLTSEQQVTMVIECITRALEVLER